MRIWVTSIYKKGEGTEIQNYRLISIPHAFKNKLEYFLNNCRVFSK